MFVLKYRGKKLNIFAPNDLPTRTPNGFSVKNIISFSIKSYYTFSTEDEAVGFINYMLKECQNESNINRWNDVHWGADDKLKNIVCSLKICYENSDIY